MIHIKYRLIFFVANNAVNNLQITFIKLEYLYYIVLSVYAGFLISVMKGIHLTKATCGRKDEPWLAV